MTSEPTSFAKIQRITRGCSLKTSWRQPTITLDNFLHTAVRCLYSYLDCQDIPERALCDARLANRITDERYRFFGIAMKVWQIGDSDRAAQFDVVSVLTIGPAV